MVNTQLKLISDLEEVHKASDLRIKEIDDQVVASIAKVQTKSISSKDLEPLGVKLWIEYSNKMLLNIDKLLTDLSLRFVKVKSFRSRFNEYKRKFNNKRNDFETEMLDHSKHLKPVKDLFYDIVKLWNDIIDAEDDLIREAWIHFLTHIYLPFATVTSGAYWALVANNLIAIPQESTLMWFVVVLILLYLVLSKLVRHPPTLEKEETIQE